LSGLNDQVSSYCDREVDDSVIDPDCVLEPPWPGVVMEYDPLPEESVSEKPLAEPPPETCVTHWPSLTVPVIVLDDE
jgi:hypothetical protein